MTQYTPGPWHMVINNKLVGPKSEPIADFEKMINVEANAQLIAAAPELLEALEYAVDWLQDAKVHADIVRNLKAAIAEARNK